jgi:hypothetical protein
MENLLSLNFFSMIAESIQKISSEMKVQAGA